MHSLRWGDLQYVLAVANEGSIAAAARSMGVNHSTVLRRLNAFEHRHKLRVFHRLAAGYKLTAEGQQLFESALSIESTVRALERKVFSREMKLEGVLRLTTTDTLMSLVLARHLKTFHRAYPRIKLDLNVTNRLLNLSDLDADVAIRPAEELPDNLAGVRLCDMAFAVYATSDYLNSLQGKHPLESADWLGLSPRQLKGAAVRRMADLIPEERVVLAADSFEALRQAAELGMGLAYMPCFVGEVSGKLQRVDIEFPYQGIGLWLMAHRDLVGSARVSAFFEFIEAELKADHNRLAGIRA